MVGYEIKMMDASCRDKGALDAVKKLPKVAARSHFSRCSLNRGSPYLTFGGKGQLFGFACQTTVAASRRWCQLSRWKEERRLRLERKKIGSNPPLLHREEDFFRLHLPRKVGWLLSHDSGALTTYQRYGQERRMRRGAT